MKTKSLAIIVLVFGSIIHSNALMGQKKSGNENFLESLPKNLELVEKTPQKYLVTNELSNSDIYGNILNKVKVTGEYIRGLKDKNVKWNNVFISHTNEQSEQYIDRVKQDYMENFTYVPSKDLLNESFFAKFEKNNDFIFARNLTWDMMSIETYAWNYYDSLKQNKTYIVPDIKGSFNMAGLGTYNQKNIELSWLGISRMNNKLCAIIEYRALDNTMDLHFENMKSKGSDLQLGKIWISLDNKQIEYAEIINNTVQEMEIEGLSDKMLLNSKRIFKMERIH